jgi:NAD(P)-dependent dehydrogenase (short-subunit alcohol dehydrogenase family)
VSHTALVTGGASGIGAAICRALLATGHGVVCLDRAAPPSAPGLQSVIADLACETATREAATEVAREHAVSHLVHCAGAIRPDLLENIRQSDLQALTQLHLGAAILLAQAVLPGMRARHFGRIVLIASRAAMGLQTRSSYAATKAGLIALARTWALELAPEGITVNAISPGPIGGTAMFHDVVPADSAREAALAASIPVRRLGRPEDVARAVLFFADADNGFVTGQNLFVCGGSSVGAMTV